MAVPSSGTLSMRGKSDTELGENNYNSTAVQYSNISLTGMSTGDNGTINTVNAHLIDLMVVHHIRWVSFIHMAHVLV